MKLAQLSLIVTDDCNFNCTYCFQEKGKQYMTKETIKKTIDFFYPFLAEDTYIIFYGGEPMLAFEQIKYAVSHFREKNKDINKKLTYSVTTNGSLVDEEALEYFNRHGFSLMLSYDGFTQDTARQPGSSVLARELIEGMNQYPGITFSINSVFSLATLPHFSHSLREIVRLGGKDVTYNLSILEPWSGAALSLLESELQKLGSFLLHHYKETGNMPVSAFRSALPPKPAAPSTTGKPSPASQGRMFACTAARDRMAVSPDEKLWGCFLFYDSLKNKGDSEDYDTYYMGILNDFISNHHELYPQRAANYSRLRQEFFYTDRQFCFLCHQLRNCSACPVSQANATSLIGKLPPWLCQIKHVETKVISSFRQPF